MVKEAVPFERINERLVSRNGGKGLDHYIEISKRLRKSIYEVICEIEKALTYDELAVIFSECSGVEMSEEIRGEVLRVNGHFIETTHGIYIWHHASLDAIAKNGKGVYIISKTTFDIYITPGVLQIVNVSQDSTKEWFIGKILKPAIKINATDIHIAPKETSGTYEIYFRVLGDLKKVMTLSPAQGNAVTRSLLYWAKDYSPSIKIDDNHRPQDGRIEIKKEEGLAPLDMRLSFIPKSNRTDTDVAVRLLYKVELNKSVRGLGFSIKHEKLMTDVSHKNKGIVLVTGTTGGGKSMTTNTILSKIDPSRNVLTVEDPIEYLLPNARQFQTFEWEKLSNEKNSVDFDDYGRAFKRHDPDVIFIGEMRDKVTAETAFHLAQTGHLVFSTLHVSRATMVPQMLFHKYGISIDEIADSLIMAINQVLVKRVCPKCGLKTIFDRVPKWFSLLSYENKDEALSRLTGKEVLVAVTEKSGHSGCTCGIRYDDTVVSMGYAGRTVLAECVPFSPEVFEDENISVTAMDKKTAEYGTVLDDAVDKILAGVIDVEALRRLI